MTFDIPEIDFHGRTSDEVLTLLDAFLAENKDKDLVRVIIGKGRGIIGKTVKEYLDLGHYPWSYERVGGTENKGALIVDLS